MRFSKVSVSLILIPLLLTATSCILERNFEPELEIRPEAGAFNYELLLRGHFRARGNPHDPTDWSETKWVQLYWIYIPVLSGRMDAADLVLTRDRGCVTEASNHWGRNLKGHIDIQNGAVTVALEVAQYDRKTSALTGHTPFEGNGAYRMSDLLKEEFQPRNEQEAESIKWHSCKYRMLPSGSKY